ncbi:hypothetical protein ABTL67_19830, partial [Acinetobacter baumannii]
FFGHPEPARVSDRAERLVTGIAAQAAIAIDNARLYQAAQAEIERMNPLVSRIDEPTALAMVKSVKSESLYFSAQYSEARRFAI